MHFRIRAKEKLPLYKKNDNIKEKPIRSRNSSKVKHKIYWRHLVMLLCAWIMLINYYERTVFKRVIKRCEWSKWEQWPKDAEAHRVGLFADPQIMDAFSYPGRPWIVNYVTRMLLDNYHKKNWKYIQMNLKPDNNVFLGDLFDGGREWQDEDWLTEYDRFNEIFPKVPGSRTFMTIPGNHDIGFGNTILPDSLHRFSTYFGEPSSYHDIGNHTFVMVDTISLSDAANPDISAVPKKFLSDFAQGDHPLPKVLLSHVPLYRNPEQQQCGTLRESKNNFPIHSGKQYQTVIDMGLSQEVLTLVEPVVLFSGDDHDYCQVMHTYPSNGLEKTAQEITVKSCAMNMGIQRPAIQLLSLFNPLEDVSQGSPTYQSQICYLPNPYKPLLMYGILSAFSLVWLIYMCLFPESFNKAIANRMGKGHATTVSALPLPVSSKGSIHVTSSYAVLDTPSTSRLLFNAAILSAFVLLVFAYYFTSI